MELREKTALVVGASSGIGRAVARELGGRGYRVALVARRVEPTQAVADAINAESGLGGGSPPGSNGDPAAGARAFVFAHDVRHTEEVPQLFEQIFETLGGLTDVYYVAGTMPKVAPDEYNTEKDRQMIEVNFLGCVAWLNAAADLFHRLKRGTIVGVGSIAGDRGRKGQPGYNASKGAQAIYLESLRNRLAVHRGVRVVTIKPGYVETEMLAGMGNLLWMISAEEAARRMVDAGERSRGTVYVPRRWRVVSWVLRAIPSFIFKKLEV